MTTQLLASELANLVQESKRKHNDLRQAAEKSLEELKQLGNVSESAAPGLLSQKPSFVNPFIIACGTKNPKFTGIAIVCLQRLIVSCALPRSKLNQVLDALMQASSAGLDVQLKILQALPSLLQNYSEDLNGELLVTTLNVCFVLQASKNAIVSNTSAATLQQLVVSVFDKVVTEDKAVTDAAPIAGEVSIVDGKVELRSAALDAYRIFHDLCLMTENQRPEFLRFSGLPQTFGLELIESVITNHATVFTTHPEQAQILRDRVVPLVISALKGKPTFATAVRLVRILYTLLRRHITILPSECGDALAILTNLLDQDTAIWKRALCMEVLRGIFAEHALVRRIWALYDAKEGERGILKMLTATFVRLSTEKPAVIGLGPQSTIPAADAAGGQGTVSDPALLEASSVAGIIGGSVVSEASNTGISTQWSSVRVPCIDQLDKTEAPVIPESYIYSLILACLSSLSDGLAKFILPLTVPNEHRLRRKASKNDGGRDSPNPPSSALYADVARNSERDRSVSIKKNPVPINPLELEDHPAYPEAKICADIVNECWPAILATCSTFLYAALDSEYYHGLVRAFQRFAHVAGLLQLPTPRDAFLSTLGKAAVPPHVLSACTNVGQSRPVGQSTPTEATSGGIFGNARGLLNVEALSPISPSADRQRQGSTDAPVSLNTRNLLCLRALLNLGIALGPTLGPAWGIIFGTLQQADFVLYVAGKAPTRPASRRRGSQEHSAEADANSLMANFSTEVKSVETAALRLLESSLYFPNDAFIEVLEALCSLLYSASDSSRPSSEGPPKSPSASPVASAKLQPSHRKVLSFSTAVSTTSNQEYQFALAKLGEIAMVNIDRLLSYQPEESGWAVLMRHLIETLASPAMNPPVRTRAAEILSELMLEAATFVGPLDVEYQHPIQLRLLSALRDALVPLRTSDRGVSVANTATDVDIHRIILEGLKSVIEEWGQSIVSGWDIAFDIIGSVFLTSDSISVDSRRPSTGLKSWSSKLVRSSFSSLELICSDFLSSLPNECFLMLVDTLHKFCSQTDDLNIALTTVTFFWALSDFLSGRDESRDFLAELVEDSAGSAFEDKAADGTRGGSSAALWMLLLKKLTSIASDDRLELRNSAIQTLFRIFDAYGESLSPEAWSICLNSVVFKLLTSLEEDLHAASDDDVDESDRSDWHETAVVVLNCVSTLLGHYLEVLTKHESFNDLWSELLRHMAVLLDFQVLDINTATFKTLSHMLSQFDDSSPMLNKATVDNAWDLWSRGTPRAKMAKAGKAQDNHFCLTAYVTAFRDVYRLIQRDLTVDHVKRILVLLRETVEEASVGNYSSDADNLTSLQTQTLDAVKTIRTDVPGVPSALIMQVSEFVTLPFEQDYTSQGKTKRTYVAMSKASMHLLEGLILHHAAQEDIYHSGSVLAALSALCRPIGLKYRFPIVTKTTQPWSLATSSALAIIAAVLPQLDSLHIPVDKTQEIWSTIACIADGVLRADESAPPGTDYADDEEADIDSFRRLVELIVPAIGAEQIADKTRVEFAKSLFRTSIIHEPTPADRMIIYGEPADSLLKLYPPRAGRTVAVPPARRTRMAYVAFEQLFTLMSADSRAVTADPSPSSSFRSRIASTVAPFLILRCAVTFRGYIADQPLRGRMPQPLSQRKELLWILRKLVDFKAECDGSLSIAGGEKREAGLHGLHPLMVKALGVRGDEVVLGLLREALDAGKLSVRAV